MITDKDILACDSEIKSLLDFEASAIEEYLLKLNPRHYLIKRVCEQAVKLIRAMESTNEEYKIQAADYDIRNSG